MTDHSEHSAMLSGMVSASAAAHERTKVHFEALLLKRDASIRELTGALRAVLEVAAKHPDAIWNGVCDRAWITLVDHEEYNAPATIKDQDDRQA